MCTELNDNPIHCLIDTRTCYKLDTTPVNNNSTILSCTAKSINFLYGSLEVLSPKSS